MTRGAGVLAAALGVALMLTACVGNPDPRITRPSADEGAPTRYDIDVSQWRITFDGIGPLEIGDTIPEIAETTGVPVSLEFAQYFCDSRALGPTGALGTISAVAMSGSLDGPVSGFSVVYWQIGLPAGDESFIPRLPRLESGVGIGSTREQVRDAYSHADGPHLELDESGYGVLTDDQYPDREIRLAIDAEHDRVTVVSVGTLESLSCGGE